MRIQEVTSAGTISTSESEAGGGASVSGLPTSGLALSASYGAPSGATGASDVSLSSTDANAVTAISQVSASGLSIAYTATADLDLAPGTYPLDVTYTIKTGD